jgi:hypothetical protein
MLNADNFPDVTTMTITEARAYILKHAKSSTGEAHDVEIDAIARPLEQASRQREQARAVIQGSQGQSFHGSGCSPGARATRVLYDAAWELVGDGLLRPGYRNFGVLNERASGFCLTPKGLAEVGKGA